MVTTFFQVLSIWQLKAARQAAELQLHSVNGVWGIVEGCLVQVCLALPSVQVYSE